MREPETDCAIHPAATTPPHPRAENLLTNRHALAREVCGGDFTTGVKRSQCINHGLDYGFADQITLLISVEAIKQ